jgi:hypothetical protein
MTTMFASLGVNLAVSVLLFFAFGGAALLRRRASVERAPAPAGMALAMPGAGTVGVTVPVMVRGSQEASASVGDQFGGGSAEREPSGTPYQMFTIAGLVTLAVLTLVYKLDIGFVSVTIALLLSLVAPEKQQRALSQVSWPEIMLIVGVSTYVGVMEKMGTIDFVGHSVAGLTSPLVAALLLCLVGAVVSAFASSTAVLGSLIPLAVPFLQQGTGVDAIGFIAAMAVASTIVDVSPFSTNGALVLANAQGINRNHFFRHLMAYGAVVTVAAPFALWLIFVVL